jgi:hypothetical protein
MERMLYSGGSFLGDHAMNASQKEATFTLGVVIATALTVAVLVPFLGKAAMGGFGFLGLLGLGPFFYVRRGAGVILDERDLQIRQRANMLAGLVFWTVFVAGAMTAPAVYGWDGAVPVWLVLASVWCGLIVMQGVVSLATLLQYAWGGRNAA